MGIDLVAIGFMLQHTLKAAANEIMFDANIIEMT